MCMLIARTCRRGRKTRFTFKEHPRLYLQVPLFRSDCAWQRSGKWLKTQNTPAARIGQVTIIYPEISLVTSPDECVWKLKVKTHTGGLTAQLKEKKKGGRLGVHGSVWRVPPQSNRKQSEELLSCWFLKSEYLSEVEALSSDLFDHLFQSVVTAKGKSHRVSCVFYWCCSWRYSKEWFHEFDGTPLCSGKKSWQTWAQVDKEWNSRQGHSQTF